MHYLLKNQSIKVLTSSRLIDYMTRRPTHFVSRMSLNNKVVNLCSASFHKRNRAGVIAEKGWETRCFYRLPLSRFRLINNLNDIAYKRFLRASLSEGDIVWAYEPFSIDSYKNLKRKLLVYEMCDDTSAYFKNDKSMFEHTLGQEEKICESADIVFTISGHLLEKKKHLNRNFHVIRNGTDYGFFSQARSLKKSEDDELYSLKGPVVGYHGAISPWIDFGLIKNAASNLRDFNFVFVGRINPDCHAAIEGLGDMQNVHFLGEIKYSDLIHYLKYFDVSIIPFVLDQLILSVNPIKMYEYLSAGKPVLSAPLPEVKLCEDYGIVETFSDVNDFIYKARKLFDLRDDSSLIEKRMELAYNNSWDMRYKDLEHLVYKALNEKNIT
jgi:hypothetical protein